MLGKLVPIQRPPHPNDCEIRCGQCKNRKPTGEFIKGARVLKSCKSCRASKEKFSNMQLRKTSRRVTRRPNQQEPMLQVAAQSTQTYEGGAVFKQSIETYKHTREWPDQGQLQAAPTFDIFDNPSAPPPTLHTAAIVRHQARRARGSKSTNATTTVLQDETVTTEAADLTKTEMTVAQRSPRRNCLNVPDIGKGA